MQVMSSTVSSSNGIGAKSRKYIGPGCFPSPSSVKKQFPGHVSGWLCQWLDWVYHCEDFTFCFTSDFVKV